MFHDAALYSEHYFLLHHFPWFLFTLVHMANRTLVECICDATTVLHDRYLKCNKLLFLHLINNYCICSFLLVVDFCPFWRGHDTCVILCMCVRWRCFFYWLIHLCPANISYFVGNSLSHTFNVESRKMWCAQCNSETLYFVDKCIQEIIFKTFINGVFHISVLLNFQRDLCRFSLGRLQ